MPAIKKICLSLWVQTAPESDRATAQILMPDMTPSNPCGLWHHDSLRWAVIFGCRNIHIFTTFHLPYDDSTFVLVILSCNYLQHLKIWHVITLKRCSSESCEATVTVLVPQTPEGNIGVLGSHCLHSVWCCDSSSAYTCVKLYGWVSDQYKAEQ